MPQTNRDALAQEIDQQLEWMHELYALEPYTDEQQSWWRDGKATFEEVQRIEEGHQTWQ